MKQLLDKFLDCDLDKLDKVIKLASVIIYFGSLYYAYTLVNNNDLFLGIFLMIQAPKLLEK